MAAYRGQNFVIKIGTAEFLTCRDTTLVFDNNPIDVTTKADNRWSSTITGFSKCTVNGSGVYGGSAVEKTFMGYVKDGLPHPYTITNESGEVWSGNFVVTNYQRGGAYNEGESFQFTLENNGEVTHAEAP